MGSSMGIQSFSSEDDNNISTDNVAVTVTHAPSTAKVPRLLQKYSTIEFSTKILCSTALTRKKTVRTIY